MKFLGNSQVDPQFATLRTQVRHDDDVAVQGGNVNNTDMPTASSHLPLDKRQSLAAEALVARQQSLEVAEAHLEERHSVVKQATMNRRDSGAPLKGKIRLRFEQLWTGETVLGDLWKVK
jgi:hypothetical protein